jgi:uncharacterized protein
MPTLTASDVVSDVTTLESLYGQPNPPSLLKEVDHIHPIYRPFIERAPFVALATSGPDGLDVTPRGDPPGFVHIEDERTLLMPDRRGNNRLDALRNILSDPRVALLFLIPGIGETLRVNGRAAIVIAPALLERFAMEGKPPRSVLRITVETVYFQCSKAIVRSGLWKAEAQIARSALPSTGTLLAETSRSQIDATAYDRAAPARTIETLY